MDKAERGVEATEADIEERVSMAEAKWVEGWKEE